ncbi:PASTA domain-containing protein [Frankia sp. CN7]|uniref:PASTA domain-containing protein n=2 Tax=Frankia nepalensis TaxID=1836974 RepID=A0A937UTB7_9ACTN|nr:PASTA domain-containing protein [Frankia nepalensis]MBL7514087.1 PASTA domain-containing protein [Frankia nepalensis]MBL7632938.1 PASTA domain-containing protein [Frankia nepalensis]
MVSARTPGARVVSADPAGPEAVEDGTPAEDVRETADAVPAPAGTGTDAAQERAPAEPSAATVEDGAAGGTDTPDTSDTPDTPGTPDAPGRSDGPEAAREPMAPGDHAAEAGDDGAAAQAGPPVADEAHAGRGSGEREGGPRPEAIEHRTLVLKGAGSPARTMETVALPSPAARPGFYSEQPTTSADLVVVRGDDLVSSRDTPGRRHWLAVTGRIPWTTVVSVFSVLVALSAVTVAAVAALGGSPSRPASTVSALVELTVPADLVGLTSKEAEARLRALGFSHVRLEMTPNLKEKGTVLAVRPGGDSRIDSTDTVTLVVSAGMESVRVPEVVGLTEAAARSTLQEYGLTVLVKATTGPAVVGRGRVSAVDPTAGVQVPAGSTITITVVVAGGGRTLATMPNVVGRPADDAQAAVRAAGFTDVALTYATSSETAGTVTATDPPAGRSTAKNTTVTLTVSTGPGKTAVADVVGQPEADARAALEKAGLVVETVSDTGPTTVGPGLVRSVDPVPGTELTVNSKVTITVVSLQVSVPNTVGGQRAQAERTLKSYGLVVSVRQQASSQPAGTVLAQNPPSGMVRRGTTVTITVAVAQNPPDGGGSPGPGTTPTTTTPPPPVSTTPATGS